MNEVGWAVIYIRLVLKVVMQNYGDFVDVILLQYPNIQTRAGCDNQESHSMCSELLSTAKHMIRYCLCRRENTIQIFSPTKC